MDEFKEKKVRVLSYITLTCLVVLIYPMTLLAQNDNQSNDNADDQPQALVLSVTQAPPQQNANVQQFHLRSGDTAFIQLTGSNSGNTGTVANADEKNYQNQLADISVQIVQKISDLNAKQLQLQNEIFPTQRPILQGQITVIQNDLQALQLRRTQIEAGQTAKVATQKANPPSSATVTQAQGINIKPELQDNQVTITVIPQGTNANQTSSQTSSGNWIRVYSPNTGGDQGVWAKVDPEK